MAMTKLTKARELDLLLSGATGIGEGNRLFSSTHRGGLVGRLYRVTCGQSTVKTIQTHNSFKSFSPGTFNSFVH